jgi:hypothetical protein
MKKLLGRTDLEDALKRLDKLTDEEARMAIVQVLEVIHTVDDRVKVVADKVGEVIEGAPCIFSQSLTIFLTLVDIDEKEEMAVIQQTANDVEQMKRLSSPQLICSD